MGGIGMAGLLRAVGDRVNPAGVPRCACRRRPSAPLVSEANGKGGGAEPARGVTIGSGPAPCIHQRQSASSDGYDPMPIGATRCRDNALRWGVTNSGGESAGSGSDQSDADQHLGGRRAVTRASSRTAYGRAPLTGARVASTRGRRAWARGTPRRLSAYPRCLPTPRAP